MYLGHLHSRVDVEAEFYLSIDFKIDGNEEDDFEMGQLLRISSNNEGNSNYLMLNWVIIMTT